jgi:glycosyltransferase involved in cell wall biosynthesis
MPLAEQRGGGELMLLDLLQHGRGCGVEWTVIFLEDGPMRFQVEALGVESRVVASGRLRQFGPYVAAIRKIAKIARERRADALLGWISKANLYTGPAGILARVPVFWYQLVVPSDKNWMDRIATALPARAVLTLSKAGQQAQKALWPHRPAPLVYPGVALDRFDPAALPCPREARRRLGLPDTGPLIGIVGRLQRWKGMHVLVDAAPALLAAHPDAHVVIVGGRHEMEARYEADLFAQIDRLGLKERVIMAGFQTNVPEWMQAMDIIVHASDNEPFGIVVIEAMALGKPVVAGNAAGPTEIITEGVDGILTPYGDAQRLAQGILSYLADAEMSRRVGCAARERALEFSTERYAGNCVRVLREFLPELRLETRAS